MPVQTDTETMTSEGTASPANTSAVDKQADPECVQCGERRSRVRAESLFCAIITGYEQPEVEMEWERHRWVGWTDRELAAAGIKPEAFDKHRRTDPLTFQWIACDDTVRGHRYATAEDAANLDWFKVGRCMFCGHADPTQPAETASPAQDATIA